LFCCFEKGDRIVNFTLRDQFLTDCLDDYGEVEKGLYRGLTVVNAMLQLAHWMGFATVFLHGCDCDYSGEKHFDGTPVDNFMREDWSDVFEQYEVSKWFYERSNRKIYNATQGGKLEVFERRSPHL
jgi:hypothetical protein